MKQISERFRAFLWFAKDWPEPYRTQAIQSYDEYYCEADPLCPHLALLLAFDIDTMDNPLNWYDFLKSLSTEITPIPDDWQPSDELLMLRLNETHTAIVTEQVEPSVTIVQSSEQYEKELNELYESLDDNGKEVMREKYPNRWEKPKEYLTDNYIVSHRFEPELVIVFPDYCTPEIDNERGEIRFVKK